MLTLLCKHSLKLRLISAAHVLTHTGMLKTIQEQVRFARARFGYYDLVDFVAVLIGSILSGEPTLLAFYERLASWADTFMALFGRNRLPHRSTLSRFLAALELPVVLIAFTLILSPFTLAAASTSLHQESSHTSFDPAKVGKIVQYKTTGEPLGITPGPDGNLWFVQSVTGQVGKITPSGQITESPVSNNNSPTSITPGPGARMWFTEITPNMIGKIATK